MPPKESVQQIGGSPLRPHPQYPLCFTPAPEQHCIYVGFGDLILAYSDEPPGVEETPNVKVRATKSDPTVVTRLLMLETTLGDGRLVRGALLDISGRRVMDLRPGANDVSRLSPGVYFVRGAQAQAQAQAVRKVVIAR